MTRFEHDARRVLMGSFGFVLLVSSLLLLFVGLARAQSEDYPPGEDRIVAVSEGESAPFSGQLFETETAIRWGFRLQRLRFELAAEIERLDLVCGVRTELLETELRLERERSEFRTSLLAQEIERQNAAAIQLMEELEAAREPPWYRTWTFGLVVGIVGTSVLIALSAWLLSYTS